MWVDSDHSLLQRAELGQTVRADHVHDESEGAGQEGSDRDDPASDELDPADAGTPAYQAYRDHQGCDCKEDLPRSRVRTLCADDREGQIKR